MADESNSFSRGVAKAFTSSAFMSLASGVHSVKLNEFYASKANTSINTPSAVSYSNILRYAANSKNLATTADFYITGSQLFSNLALHMRIRNGTNTWIQRGWGWMVIDKVQITLNNSGLSPQQIEGRSMLDYALLCAPGQEARQQLLEVGGTQSRSQFEYVDACIPLACFLQNTSGLNFPLDMSQMGSIRISITFKDYKSFISQQGVITDQVLYDNLPTAFDVLEIVGTQTTIEDTNLTASHIISQNPGTKYVLPSHYITSSKVPVQSYDVNSSKSFFINDAPDCHLTGMIVSLNLDTQLSSHTNVKVPVSIPLDSCRLSINGTDLVRWDTEEEYKAMIYQKMQGDSLNVDYKYQRSSLLANASYVKTGYDNSLLDARKIKGCLYFLPLGHHERKILTEHHNENLPNYKGKSLLFECTPKPSFRTDRLVSNNDPAAGQVKLDNDFEDPVFQNGSMILASGSENCTFNITFVGEAALKSDNQYIEMIR